MTLSGNHRPGRRGMTLIEVLIVVAIIGIITSIALPGLTRAMTRARVTASGQSLRELHQGMVDWGKDANRFPTKPEFNKATLDPMVKDGAMSQAMARGILAGFQKKQLYVYAPDPGEQGYVIYALVRGTTYVVRMESGVITKRDTARATSEFTPIDDWVRGR